MQIRTLKLKNFRGFATERSFEFAERFTVFAGVNGKGKTSVLDALAFTLSRLLPQISKAGSYVLLDGDDVHEDPPHPADQPEQDALPAEGDAPEKDAGLRVEISTSCAGIPVDFWATYDPEKGSKRRSLPRAVRTEVSKAYGDPKRADDASPLAVYYTTDRAGYRIPKKLPTNVPKGQAAAYRGALLNRTVDYRDFMARFRADVFLADGGHTENPNFIGKRCVDAVEAAIGGFLDGFSNLHVEVEPRLRLMVDKNGTPLNIGQLSDGERSFIAMVSDLGRRLALANPELKNPLEGSGVVLIDEIELHLHPKWQREVVEKLRKTFPNIQFVATTHSPFVMQSLHDAKLNMLDVPDSEPAAPYSDESIENIAEEVMGVDMPQKSTRYLAMMEAAEKYFRLLRAGRPLGDAAVAAAEVKLEELSAPFSDDPAFQALLKVERETTPEGGADAAGQ